MEHNMEHNMKYEVEWRAQRREVKHTGCPLQECAQDFYHARTPYVHAFEFHMYGQHTLTANVHALGESLCWF